MVVLSDVSNMNNLFWGVTLDGGKRYTQTVEHAFHISMAALEPVNDPSSARDLKYVSLWVHHQQAEFLLCTLEHGKRYNQQLDLNFMEGEDVTFFLNGKGVVHLSGYIDPDEPEEGEDESSEEMYSDLEDEEVPQLKEIDIPDSDEEDIGGKRKRKQAVTSMKKTRKSLLMDDDSDDDSDDDDFNADDLDSEEEDSEEDEDEEGEEQDSEIYDVGDFLDEEAEETQEWDEDAMDMDDSEDEESEDEDEEDSDDDDVLGGSFLQEKSKKSKSTPISRPKTATPGSVEKFKALRRQGKTPKEKETKQNVHKTKLGGSGDHRQANAQTPSSEKKKKKKQSEQASTTNQQVNAQTPSSEKKKKKKQSEQASPTTNQQTPNGVTSSKKKNKNKFKTDDGEKTPKTPVTVKESPQSTTEKKKRKRKKKNKGGETPMGTEQTPKQGGTPGSEKKKQNKGETPTSVKEKQTPSSQKKPKKQVLDAGTIMEEIKEGHGPEAKNGKMVHVFYTGRLQSGKVFDSNTGGKPFKFRLGKKEVIRGWDIGLNGMKVGSKRKITVPPNAGYGSQRVGDIPPNSTLMFDVELKAVS